MSNQVNVIKTTTQEKLLLIIAYQFTGQRTSRGERICPLCGLVGGHLDDCELGKMEKWVREELIVLWRKTMEEVKDD